MPFVVVTTARASLNLMLTAVTYSTSERLLSAMVRMSHSASFSALLNVVRTTRPTVNSAARASVRETANVRLSISVGENVARHSTKLPTSKNATVAPDAARTSVCTPTP